MSGAMLELELSDGSILELPADTSPEAIMNYAQRAERSLAMNKGYETPAMNGVSAALTGVNRGIARALDAPGKLLRFGLNKASNALGYGDMVNPDGAMLENAMSRAEMIQPTRGYDTVAALGEGVGSGLTMAIPAGALAPVAARAGAPAAAAALEALGPSIKTGSGPLANALRTTGQQAAGTALSMAGGTAAGGAASAVSDSPVVRGIAETLGSVAAPMAPPVVGAGGRAGIRLAFGRPNGGSARAFDVLERAGITPRPGLVGNEGMARVENTYAALPIVGAVPQARVGQTFREWQDSFFNATDEIAPRTQLGDYGERVAPAPDMVGGEMRSAAKTGRENLATDFSNRYDRFFDDKPIDTIVEPNNLNAEVTRQNSPFTGESMGTRGSVNSFVDDQIAPLTQSKSEYGEYGPVQSRTGVPINTARKARTEAFYNAQGGNMKSGATEQVRQAWTKDIEEALLKDPAMVRAFPDPAARAAEVERLRVLDTENAFANDPEVSRAGGGVKGDRFYVGGDMPALDEITATKQDSTAFNVGSEPGRMAVLQRTNPEAYPSIAAGVLQERAGAQMRNADVNTSPQKFTAYWNARSPNQKLILTNERNPGVRSFSLTDPTDPAAQAVARAESSATPVKDRLDTLSQAGALFADRRTSMNTSNSAPNLATMGMGVGIITNPITTMSMLGSSALGGAAVSSQELARILAGKERSTASRAAQAGLRASAREVVEGL